MLRITRFKWIFALAAAGAFAQTPDAGRRNFESRCSVCHGADGNGGELGPQIVRRLATKDDQELATLIRDGIPSSGMPANKVPDTEMPALIAFLRSLKPPNFGGGPERGNVQTADGKTLEGLILGRTLTEMQLRTSDQRIHLLRKSGDRYREVTSQTDWTGYNGQPGGNRYTTLDQINRGNVARLALKWVYPIANAPGLEGTPVVSGGLMYVTGPNECDALDAGSGRMVWRFQRPRTHGLIGNAAGGINRGVALAGERVFMVTDNAHLLALNRLTGELAWETEMADWHQNYNATSAPLTVGSLVVSGTAGGEQGVRGFVAAWDQETGKEVWRFWTVPKAGEPGSETWQGKGIEHPSAATWFTGTYDPQLDTLYWPTGNPGADYNGDDRPGDNLYSDSILALDPKSGKLKWYYQFTPHDVWDWDATETPVLVDANWQGQPRKLLLHANRNGFFYVFDRESGKLLLTKQFVKTLTWASGIGPDGRPIKNPNQEPEQATKVCPSQTGATNWYSPSFNPATGLYYVQTLEGCTIYTKRGPLNWQAGRSYLGGAARRVPNEETQKILRAINIQTGATVWELPETPTQNISWGGTLSTASGLVVLCEHGGALMVVDAVSGKPLWSYETNQSWRASPMTYMFDGKQYIAVAAGSNFMAFALPD